MALNIRKPKFTTRNPNNPESVQQIEIVSVSGFMILKVIGMLVLAYFLWSIREVLGILFVALVLGSALDPWVDSLERYRIPRALSIILIYLAFICVFSIIIYAVVPPLISQITDITVSLRQYTPQIESVYRYITQSSDTSVVEEFQKNLSNVSASLGNLTSGVFNAVSGFVGFVAALLIVMVITFYMTIEEDGLKKFIRSIAPIQYQPYLVQKVNRIQERMGAWFRGQLILMLIVATLAFIGLAILQVPYALVLACFAGLAEFIPFLGPMVAAVPAVFFAYTDSPWKAVAVIIFYIILQQIENQAIVPQVMKKAVGLNPIIILAVMLIGAKVAGVVGILLAVPATTILWIFLEDLFQQKKQLDNQLEDTAV